MKFRVTRVQEDRLQNGYPLTIVQLDVGYDEFLELHKTLPRPTHEPGDKKPCPLCVRATRPDGSAVELLASLATSNRKLPHALLGFYRRRVAEIPVGSELELLGYETSPI